MPVMVARGDAASGALVDVATTGVFSLPKVYAEMIALGQALYLDGGLLTTDDDEGGNTKVGVAVALAPNPSATVKVRLSGF